MDDLVGRQYEASMAKNLTVLNNFPHSLTDQALFQIGLLYAHPENPNRNYQKSLGSFSKIIHEFSKSRLRPRTQLWILFIENAIDQNRKIGVLNEKNVALAKTVEQQKIDLTSLHKKIETRRNVDLIDFLEKTIDEQKKEITQLMDQIEKLKRVDLGIEEKKQKILQQNENIEEKSNGENSGS